MQVKPLNDRLLVRRDAVEETSQGGILLPENAQEKSTQGTVVARGDGYRQEDGSRTSLTVRVGDTVVFGKYTGQEITVSGEDYLILREDEVYATVEETAVAN